MKNKLILAIIAASMLHGCTKPNENEQEPTVTPYITIQGLNGNSLSVSYESTDTTINYEIADPVEGGTVSAKADDGWVETDCSTENKIALSISANPEDMPRSTIITITYTYLESKTVEAQVNLIQEAGVTYDYELNASVLTGSYYKDSYGVNGEDNYYTWLSDKPFEGDAPIQGGTYYLLSLYSEKEPDDPDNPLPKTGTYKLGAPGKTDDMTMSYDETKRKYYSASGETTYFADGTLIISQGSGDTLIYDAVLEDRDGKLHHVRYAGPASYINMGGGDSPDPGSGILDHDVELNNPYVTADYRYGNNNATEVRLRFSEGEDLFADVTAYIPFDQNGYLTPGKYEVSSGGNVMSIMPGKWWQNGDFLSPKYSYVVEWIDNVGYQDIVEKGTMTVTGENGNVTISLDLTLESGHKASGTYEGSLAVQGIPQPFSTLTSDAVLDLSGSTAGLYYYGDAYETGGNNWYIYFDAPEGKDGMQIDLVTDGRIDYTDGIPSGTYTVSNTSDIYAGTYAAGEEDYGWLYGSVYFYDIRNGVAYGMAPAMDGDLNIVNNGNGNYNIEFSFTDDKGHTWSGSWTGNMEPITESSASVNTRRTTPHRSRHLSSH